VIARAELKATRGDIAGAQRLPEPVRAPAATWIDAAAWTWSSVTSPVGTASLISFAIRLSFSRKSHARREPRRRRRQPEPVLQAVHAQNLRHGEIARWPVS